MNNANIEIKAPKAVATTVGDGTLRFDFGDGRSAVITIADLSLEIIEQATIHGLRQKVQDAAAISRNTDTGASATFGDKADACIEIVERLQSGFWNKPAGESREDVGGMLLRALRELQPAIPAEVQKAKIAAWTKEEKAAVRLNPRVKVILDRFAAEKVKNIDSDDLLGEI